MAKSGRPRIQIYIKIFQKCSACYKTIFDSTTNHLNLSLMFRALTEIFILQTGNASCSPQLADSQELNLFAGTHS